VSSSMKCRIQAVAAQRSADRGCRDPNAEVQQLTLDALVAPARVLCGQADDQLLDVLVELRPPLAKARVGPRACDQAPVPAQQRLRGNEEAGPAGPRKHTTDRGQQGAVGGLEPGSWDLAVQHAKLWRSTRISKSLAASPQASRASSWMERQSVR
jgi:hypothetical protein